MGKIRVMLVDDHEMIRDGIESILNSDKEIVVINKAQNGAEAIQLLETIHGDTDVIIMDITMPELNGVDAVKIISKTYDNIPVLALSMHSDESYILDMVQAGALGYILKDSSGKELIESVKTVARGEKYFVKEVYDKLLGCIVGKTQIRPKKSPSVLSNRENDVLKAITSGKTTKEIAANLSISNRTVESHRSNIMHKLGVKNTAQLVSIAYQDGLV